MTDIQTSEYSMLKKRMYSLIKSKYESIALFAEAAKLEYTNTHKWTSVKTSTQPNLDIIIAIARLFPNVNLRNLLLGNTELTNSSDAFLIAAEPRTEYLKEDNIVNLSIRNQQTLIEMLQEQVDNLKKENETLRKK